MDGEASLSTQGPGSVPLTPPGARSVPRGRAVPAPRKGTRLLPADELESLLGQFRRRMEGEEKSRWTVKQYEFTARHFLTFVGKPLAEIEPQDLERWREHLVLVKHYSKASVYSALRAASYLLRTFGSNAAERVEVPRRSAKLPNFLTEEEAHRLLGASEGDVRDRAILHVLLYGGLRVGELTRLAAEDLDLDHNLIRVRAGKGDKDRVVVVDRSTCESLRGWLEERATHASGNLRVFPVCVETVQRMVRARAEEAGITKEVTPHTLRHTLATTLLKRGLDLRFIQKQLGHASVATTQIYTHVDTGALQEAYDRSRPVY